MPIGNNDFFLSFGSNAAEFSELLGRELQPGIASIRGLIEAMEQYDETATYSRGRAGSPLANLFTEMDRAASNFGRLTSELAGTFQGAIRGISDLQAELSALLDEVTRITAASTPASRRRAATSIVQATEDEVASVRPRSDFNLEKIITDAWNARNALKRVGDINATVARNAADSATALSTLGQSIRTLTLQSKASTRNVEDIISSGNLGGAQVIVVQGNGAVNVADTHTADAPTVAGTVPTRSQTREELSSLTGPARIGQFLYDGKKLSVGAGVREGESFQEYFSRIEAVKARIAEAYRQVPQLSSDFDEIIRVYKSAGNKFPQDLLRPTNQGEAQSRGDIVSSLGKIGRFDALAQGVGLTAGQRSRLPDALRAFQEQIIRRDELIEQALRSMLAEDPLLTQDGLSDDAKRILKRIDTQIIGNEEYAAEPDTPAYLGAANRQRIREQGAEAYANRRALRDATRDYERRNGRFGSNGPASVAGIDDRTESVRAFVPSTDTVRVYHGRGAHDLGDDVHVAADATVAGRYAVRKGGDDARLFQADIPVSALEGHEFYTEGAKTFKIPASLLHEYGQVVAEGVEAVKAFVGSQQEIIAEFAALGQDVAVNTRLAEQVKQEAGQATGVKGRREALRKEIKTSMTAQQIRQVLKDEYGFSDNVDEKGKSELAKTLARKRQQDEARTQTGAAGGSGGGRGSSASAAAADDDSESQKRNTRARKENTEATNKQAISYRDHISLLSDDTKNVLANAREQLAAAKTEAERLEILKQAGAVYREDPYVKSTFNRRARLRNATFGEALGLAPSTDRRLVTDLFKQAGHLDADTRFTQAASASSASGGGINDERYLARRAELEKLLYVEDLNLQNAYAREYLALEKLQTLEREEPENLEKMLRARMEYNSALQNTNRTEAQVNPTTSQRIFGQKGFAAGLLRNAGYAAENFLSFTLLFTGFEHLKEALGDATKAQVEFTRVQSALAATGRSADGLRSSLQGVASATAQSQAEIVSAAAELTGVLTTNQDIAAGAGIAGQLANISQGALTAKEAAIELRDVIDAFGLKGEASLQRVGDEVAKISQITGVSVKDVLEGTANLAQEANDYHLSSTTAGLLAAEVTKNTGETGEGASEQVSRILSTLNTGKVQDALVKFRVATREQFAQGDLGDVLKNLLEGFDKLSPSAQQAIFSLVGAGRQARAFTGLLRDSGQLAGLFNGNLQVTGALASQNARFLHTLGGEMKQLESDFTSLTSTLLKLGLFDIIGVTAKALDDLLKILNEVASVFNSAFDSNPVTASLKHVIITLGEAVIAFRLFRIAMASAFGKGAATEAEAGAEAVASSTGGVSRGTRISQRLAPAGTTVGLTTIYTEGGTALRTARPFRYLGTAGERLESAVSTAASTEASTLAGRAAQRAAQATRSLAVGLQSLGDVMIATGAESKAASLSAGAMNGVLAGLAVAIPLILEGYQKEKEKAKITANTIKDLQGEGPDKPDSEKTPLELAVDNANSGKSYVESYRDFFTGGPKGTSFGRRLLNIGDTLGGLANPASYGGSISDLFHGNFTAAIADSPLGFSSGSGGNTSDKFNDDEFTLLHRSYQKLRDAKTPKEIAAVQKEINDTIAKNSERLVKEAGDSDAQKVAAAELENLKNSINESADKRHAILEGQKQVDILNAQQMISLGQVISSVQGLNSKTLASTQDYIKVLLNDSFFATDDGSATSKLLSQGTNPNRSTRGRLRSLRDAIDINLPDEEYKLGDQEGVYGKPGPQHDQLLQAVGQQVQILQQLNDTLFQQPIQAFQAASDFLASIGHYDQSTNKLKQTRTALLRYLKTLDRSQPEFWSTLKQINDNELKIAQIYDENINYQSDLTAAGSEDPIVKAQAAKDKSDRAVTEADKAAKKARTAQVALDEINVKSAQAKLAQVKEALNNLPDNASPQQVAAATRAVNAAEQALADARSTLANDKGVGGKHLTESQKQANINKASTDLAYAQAQEALKEAQISAKNAGLVSQRTNLQNQLNEVLRQEQVYRKGVLKDDQKLAELEAQEANLRLQLLQQQQADKYAREETLIAQLQARGGGDLYTGKNNDLVKAAQLQLQEAKQKARDYLSLPGASKNDAEYQQLIAQVASARRNAFDTALQAQLDTLDFQVDTYKISSAQEVESLRQILKNKQLTLAEQRQITEKIVSLQKQVRDELTSGGFNIPTDIKLPSAYQIRRSLGSTGGPTVVTTTNNTNNNVNIHNVVPSTAMAQAVAREVLGIINGSNASASRANAPTPRLVGG